MILAPKPADDAERLSALYRYKLLGTLPEKEYDNITRIASDICGTPISLVTLIDDDEQYLKSHHGQGGGYAPRDTGFCSHAILNPHELMEVQDSSKDERFHDNPNAIGDEPVAFYAGVPLVNEEGYPLGALCVIDRKPKILTPEQKETLKALARQVVAQFELRRKNMELAQQKEELQSLNRELERFAYVAAHDLKSPCSNLVMLTSYLKEEYADKFDKDGMEMLDGLQTASGTLTQLIDGILKHTRMVNANLVSKEHFNFGDMAAELVKVVDKPAAFSITYDNANLDLLAPKTPLFQVLLNLTVNAVKYNDKVEGKIHLTAVEDGDHYTFSVSDNGPGIPQSQHEKIFELFSTLGYDNQGGKGSGIGLSTVKRLVEKYEGRISLTSETGQGATFTFTMKK